MLVGKALAEMGLLFCSSAVTVLYSEASTEAAASQENQKHLPSTAAFFLQANIVQNNCNRTAVLCLETAAPS